MRTNILNRFQNSRRQLILAAQFSVAIFLLTTTVRSQVALQDGSPLAIVYSVSTNINQPFTVTVGAGVMVVCLEDKGASLTEPATMAWGGQTLTRDVQTAYNAVNPRSLAIYHLYNPVAGTANITGTVPNATVGNWVTAYTLSGVDTTIAPLAGSTNSGTLNPPATNYFTINLNVVAGAWAAVSSEFANNTGMVVINGSSGTTATISDYNDATTAASAGYVAGLSAGMVTFSNIWATTPYSAQKQNFAVDVFTPSGTPRAFSPQAFGIKFLGNTTDSVTGSAGVIPISGWNNIADATFTSGNIYSSDRSVSATLTRSGPGIANTWNSGAYPDGGNGSLMDGYNDAHPNDSATNVISGLTGAAYDVYLYTGGDVARPSSATDYLPNYTINGTTYYTATLKGYDAILKMIQGVPASQNNNAYPPALVAGQYLKIDNVAPVGGTITISANSDSLTYRSPLNGIEIVQRGNAPQFLSQPAAHRLYTGGMAQFQVQAESVNPLVYFWRKNGADLNDGGNVSGSATTNLTISNLAVTDTGDYDVVITNSFGSVTSQVAHLDSVVETQADAAYENWLTAYLVTTNGYQTYIVNSLSNRNFAFMWQQAYMIWMVEDTYNRTQSPDQKQLINNLLNTFIWQNHSDLTWDGWDDDVEWGAIALVKGYQAAGNVAALNSAILNWNSVMSRGWDNAFGGGIWENSSKSTKLVLSDCPQIIAGIALYQITGQTNYLATCENIYAWTRTNTFIATTAQATNGMNLGQVNEGVQYATTNNTGLEVQVSNNSYNSGLFASAASLLYQFTGNTQYLADAILAANQKVNNEPVANEDHIANGDFGAEQLIRSVTLIASQNQNNLWPTYWPWLQVQCAAAWNERRTDYNLTWNKWASATPAGTNDLDSMESESASLVQQATPAGIPGFVNCTNKLSGTVIGTSGSYNNAGNTIAMVFDGNLNTFFDAPANSGSWVGLDFGVGVSNVISQINYWPRVGFASRMLGGIFQGDNSPTFPDPVTLFTITVVPPDGGIVSAQPITNQTAFRCVRYVGPANAACNVAELQFFSPNLPPAPIYLTNSWNGSQMSLNWPNGGLLLEATNVTGPWATNINATPPFLITPDQPQKFYRVMMP